jgi:murein L,D-transpeptidase YafK
MLIWLLFWGVPTVAQPPQDRDFMAFQKSFKRVDEAFVKIEDTLKAQFAAKGLAWPAKYMYIRSFKLDSRLEIWVKNEASAPYKRFTNYRVCALAGSLGPKRYEGDYQVPEGFYYINEFKPNSQYHLALGVNYPNASDLILSDEKKPGGEIFVHGSCVTVGCIPLTDPIIEEVYVLAASTRAAGQDFIPIHVFPVLFKKDKSKETLEKYLDTRPDYKPLAHTLEKVYYYCMYGITMFIYLLLQGSVRGGAYMVSVSE